MNFWEYQIKAIETAIYPNVNNNLEYPTLGLCGEAGEVANIIKKIQRDDHGLLSIAKRQELYSELGDVLWYLAAICNELGVTLEDIANHNIAKLDERRKSNEIKKHENYARSFKVKDGSNGGAALQYGGG